jgi:Iron-sulfur cluster assembly accessory protein
MEAIKDYQVLVTPKAAEQIKIQLIKRGTPDGHLRLGVKGGGCSGFSYVLQFEDLGLKERDILFEAEGIHLVVDNKSILFVNGCTLDWEKSLMNQGFKIINPNEKSKCGCGYSFTV